MGFQVRAPVRFGRRLPESESKMPDLHGSLLPRGPLSYFNVGLQVDSVLGPPVVDGHRGTRQWGSLGRIGRRILSPRTGLVSSLVDRRA